MTLTEALAHPLFDKVRGTPSEKFEGNPVSLDFEKMNLDSKTLRRLIYKELELYGK